MAKPNVRSSKDSDRNDGCCLQLARTTAPVHASSLFCGKLKASDACIKHGDA